MKLRTFSLLMQATEALLSTLHSIARPLIRLREWAWVRCTRENLKSCNVRSTHRLS
jgi:hypothetical protein